MFGVVPVLVLPSWDGWGRAAALFVFLPKGASEALLQHELQHIRQNILFLFVPFTLLYLFSEKFRFRAEAAAYAKNVRVMVDQGEEPSYQIKRNAIKMKDPRYKFSASLSECEAAISKYLLSGRII